MAAEKWVITTTTTTSTTTTSTTTSVLPACFSQDYSRLGQVRPVKS